MGAKRLGGKRLGGKRLGGETTRGRNGLGAKRPGFLIKASESSFMSIYTRLFNSVLDTGHVLRALSYRFIIITAVEIIQNYRGITILSLSGYG